MIVDPSNAAAIYSQNKDQGVAAQAPSEEHVNAQERQSSSGQTSEAGPAVITSFSATALETARAVNESEQTADQDKARNGTEKSSNEEDVPAKREERIDLII